MLTLHFHVGNPSIYQEIAGGFELKVPHPEGIHTQQSVLRNRHVDGIFTQ